MSTFDELLPWYTRFIRFVVDKWFTNNTNYFLVSCSYCAKKLYLKHGFSSSKIKVVPNGIDFKRFSIGRKNTIAKKYNLSGRIVLGVVGRLSKIKNHILLINLVKDLKSLNLVLLIVGDGPEMFRLKSIIDKFELNDRIILTGNQKNIPDFLAVMNIFVFPSLSEGWPNAVGEAMAAGLPVVTSNVGDIPNIIKNGYNGIIVDNNEAAFKKAVTHLISDKALCLKLGKSAKETIKNNFTVNKMIDKYQNLYLNSLQNKKVQ